MLFKIFGVLVVLVFLLLLMYVIEYYKINMDPMKKPVKVEEIVVETFVPDDNYVESFEKKEINMCQEYKGDNNRLDKGCKALSFENCMDTECCIWGGEKGLPNIKKNGNCTLGNNYGPIFKGSAFDNSEFYYQGQKFPKNF
mgnify:FL=1|uniref:Uncharacterized protein n=1 Tax=viral metagenome TaxID=1070528 RepID=A0A6C0AXG8_9ZZZZ|tara:strand:- start:5858 stop:6280 length:423 start_codon:yes stop_codon:yes gene_type:complete